jgi:hypothetical protein
MPERKLWSAEEDQVLKLLVEERKMAKWSHISRVMEEEFQLAGRNGKQCRERYIILHVGIIITSIRPSATQTGLPKRNDCCSNCKS